MWAQSASRGTDRVVWLVRQQRVGTSDVAHAMSLLGCLMASLTRTSLLMHMLFSKKYSPFETSRLLLLPLRLGRRPSSLRILCCRPAGMSLSIYVPPLPFPVTIDQILQGLRDANATRYLSGACSLPRRFGIEVLNIHGLLPVVGLVVLLYDHALTFSDEVTLVWAAPRSFAKYAYIFNRYLVMACLLAVAHGE